MKLKHLILLFSIGLLCASCEDNSSINIDADNLLLGSWIEPIYDGETTTFKRSNTLPNESYGVSFAQNGDFTERTSGFCGTPPLTFFNVDGSFTLEDALVSISVQSYPSFYGWKIIELTEEKLVVKRELSEQEKDHRVLMDLFNEISELAYNSTCTDSTEWTFTPFGAKACGGPQGYLPYSKNIDTVAFLEKIAAYTAGEKEFNIKWSVISDCALVNPPKSIGCQNGYPIFNY